MPGKGSPVRPLDTTSQTIASALFPYFTAVSLALTWINSISTRMYQFGLIFIRFIYPISTAVLCILVRFCAYMQNKQKMSWKRALDNDSLHQRQTHFYLIVVLIEGICVHNTQPPARKIEKYKHTKKIRIIIAES